MTQEQIYQLKVQLLSLAITASNGNQHLIMSNFREFLKEFGLDKY